MGLTMTKKNKNENEVDFDLVSACRRLYTAIDHLDDTAAKHLGVSRNDLRCLNLLENGPVSPSQISSRLGLTSGTVTTLIDRLEAKKLVKRKRDPDDRRGVLVEPTARLYKILGPLYAGVAKNLTHTAQGYSEQERLAAINHLRDAAKAYEDALIASDNEKG